MMSVVMAVTSSCLTEQKSNRLVNYNISSLLVAHFAFYGSVTGGLTIFDREYICDSVSYVALRHLFGRHIAPADDRVVSKTEIQTDVRAAGRMRFAAYDAGIRVAADALEDGVFYGIGIIMVIPSFGTIALAASLQTV